MVTCENEQNHDKTEKIWVLLCLDIFCQQISSLVILSGGCYYLLFSYDLIWGCAHPEFYKQKQFMVN